MGSDAVDVTIKLKLEITDIDVIPNSSTTINESYTDNYNLYKF